MSALAKHAYGSKIAENKIDGLKKYYGASKGDETLKFFEVHQSADIIHRQVIKELLGDVCDTEAKKRRGFRCN